MTADFSDEFQLLSGLKKYPRAELFQSRTDIELLPRLGGRLGIVLQAKRDDTLPLAMGGNKIRQLEYYLGQAVQQNADSVLITGAIQSNFVRLCAAAARKIGMEPHVQLEQRVPNDDPVYNSSGNVLLDRLLGAKIHYFTDHNDEAAADRQLDLLAQELVRTGKNPYVIHLGTGHPPFGGLGYAQAAAETYVQCKAADNFPDHVVVASGSGLTHAGFLVGARASGWQVPVHGICVRRNAAEQRLRITQRAEEINQLLGCESQIAAECILVDDNCLSPGYGQMNDQVIEAIKLGAEDEGLLLDPVYSGRAMAGLIDLVRRKMILPGQSVMFIHTGGLPSIFAYQNELLR